ncbi:DNA/RNA nuclease SfsA [Treponema sp. J25]|uniref:DNA/RNA nuclease SfsA n=1 Tax=Treponema sp. J25 TaxID=2094121 RepID=UPI001FB56F0C|nr:DNA/RNA nuclease SfsA [Treponema sp. J25]
MPNTIVFSRFFLAQESRKHYLIDMEEYRCRLFSPDREARFLKRPNRFLIIAEDPERGEEIPCHCPNPGRLLEFVIPGTELILERRLAAAKTAWTAVAVRYGERIVPLFSARANSVVQQAVLPVLFPEARHIQAEYSQGNSRFDFLVEDATGSRHLIEVKACSLVEHDVAMFPDAPSERATKHLEELAALSQSGFQCHVLFLVVHGKPQYFVPNLHTDPSFAAAVSRYNEVIQFHAAVLEAQEDGSGRIINFNLPLVFDHGTLAEENRGSYLILMELNQPKVLTVGALGTLALDAGWYVYTGSAQKNLSQRIAHHLRKVHKNPHWHIDYLTSVAARIMGLPIASYRNLECALAADLERIGGRPIPRFGCSDCSCDSHLYYFPTNPLTERSFLDLLFWYRHVKALERG